jgi:hypothetical protein
MQGHLADAEGGGVGAPAELLGAEARNLLLQSSPGKLIGGMKVRHDSQSSPAAA